MELLDIIIMEELSKRHSHNSHNSPFKRGDKVVCKLTERPEYFNSDGAMDTLLNKAQELEVVFVISDKSVIVFDHVKKSTWQIIIEDLELAPKVE